MHDKLHEFKTDAITVTWSKARCIHAAQCIQALPEVFPRELKGPFWETVARGLFPDPYLGARD